MNWIVSYLFKKWYNGYVLPFESADAVIAKMPDPEKTEYYRQAKDLLENRAFILETQEAVRKYMQHLSLKSNNETERAAYRLTLKFIQDYEQKFRERALMYKKPVVSNLSNRF